jgi:hypothetical protein
MDKTTKVLLAIIAAGLWANVATPVIQQARAYTSGSSTCNEVLSCLRSVNSYLSQIAETHQPESLYAVKDKLDDIDRHIRNLK